MQRAFEERWEKEKRFLNDKKTINYETYSIWVFIKFFLAYLIYYFTFGPIYVVLFKLLACDFKSDKQKLKEREGKRKKSDDKDNLDDSKGSKDKNQEDQVNEDDDDDDDDKEVGYF